MMETNRGLPKLNKKEIPLSSLPLGREGIITRILDSNTHRRILTLGLLPGTPIKAISRAPLGDPIVFHVRGHRLALRGKVAEMIFVNISSKEV
jgi:ferrous iron transport protein A